MLDEWIKEFLLWNGTHNFMASEEAANLSEHIEDSLSLAPFLEETGCPRIVDIGSGGGFPLIPLALWAKEGGKNWHFTATDVVDKKIAFLKWSRAKFSLPMDVVKVDKNFFVEEPCVIVSRAFSDVAGIIKWSRRYTPSCIQYLLLKGRKAQEELAAAKISAYEILPGARGCIIRMGGPGA